MSTVNCIFSVSGPALARLQALSVSQRHELYQRSLAQSTVSFISRMTHRTRKTMEFKDKTSEEVVQLITKASGPVLLLMKEHFETVEPDEDNKADSILGQINSKMLSFMFQKVLTMSEEQEMIKKKVTRPLRKQGRSESRETLLGGKAYDTSDNEDDNTNEDDLDDDKNKNEGEDQGGDDDVKSTPTKLNSKAKPKAVFSAEALAAASRALAKYKPEMHFASWCTTVERHGRLYNWNEKVLVKFVLGLLSWEANNYLRTTDVDDMLRSSWSTARRLLEDRFFKSSHSGFARQEAENYKQTDGGLSSTNSIRRTQSMADTAFIRKRAFTVGKDGLAYKLGRLPSMSVKSGYDSQFKYVRESKQAMNETIRDNGKNRKTGSPLLHASASNRDGAQQPWLFTSDGSKSSFGDRAKAKATASSSKSSLFSPPQFENVRKHTICHTIIVFQRIHVVSTLLST